MLIFLQYIFDCLVDSRPRANELKELRRRFAAMDSPKVAGAEESASALRQRALREAIGARLGEVVACTDCVRPKSTDWPGGGCCAGPTEDVFFDEELASLKLAGTTPRHFRAPKLSSAHRATHTGCIFRGLAGCSLPPSYRPNLCVRYTCSALQRELDQRKDSDEINQLNIELKREFTAFEDHRRKRLLQSTVEALLSGRYTRQ